MGRAGLYEFVAVEGHRGESGLADALNGQGFEGVRLLRALPGAKHVFTHLVWRMQGWLAACDAAPGDYVAIDPAEVYALPFPPPLRVYGEIGLSAGRLKRPQVLRDSLTASDS